VSERLTAAQWAARMRDEYAALDKSYRQYPLGQLVGRYMRAISFEGKAENTRISYEPVLRLFVLFFSDLETLEPVGLDQLYEFLNHHWSDSSDATKRQRAAILRSFFAWAVDAGHTDKDPTSRLKTPKPPQPLRLAHELEAIKLLASAGNVRDEAAVLLMGRLAFRKSDVRLLQARDVDLAHDLIYIRKGKAGKPASMPIEFEDVREALSLWLTLVGDPREYLLHPRHNRLIPLEASTMQRWWARLFERVGESYFPMHELRHSALDRLWRKTGNLEIVRQFARHESIKTTQAYLHPTDEDLRQAMRASELKE
jgi:integrase